MFSGNIAPPIYQRTQLALMSTSNPSAKTNKNKNQKNIIQKWHEEHVLKLIHTPSEVPEQKSKTTNSLLNTTSSQSDKTTQVRK